jgi:polyisoprenoid-binding protein YceI
MKTALIALTSILLTTFSGVGEWKTDPSKARITFKTSGTFGEINGSFSGLKATIKFDEADLISSSILVYIDPKTIETGISLRNHHLKEEEKYLNSSRFPVASFSSKQILKTAEGFKAIGDMTIKGMTKLVEIPFSFARNTTGGIFKGQFSINALDYKVGPDSKLVTFVFEIPVTK